MGRKTATATLMIDDERVRVTRFDFPSGAETRWHRHEMDYVITAITDCQMLLEEPRGRTPRRSAACGNSLPADEGC